MKRLVLPLLLASAAALSSCGRGEHAVSHAGDEPPLEVQVVRAGAAPDDPLVLPARVAAREEVTLEARVAARLTALPLREGDRFRRGQVLARFEAPETRAALQGARAGLEAATYQRDLARLQEARMESLYAARVAALREVEGARAERRGAEAAWAQANAAASQMESATAIEAPFDGVVVRRHADVGATLGPGQALLDLRSHAVGEITAAVPESELSRLEGPAEFQVGAGPWREARLARVDGMTDFATRSRVARFRPAEPGKALEAGAFARVRLAAAKVARTGGDDALASMPFSVPSRALVRRGALTGVFVVEDQVAHLRWLRVGRESGEQIEVLAGLEPGDQVVADPAGLEDGRRVKVAP
jgi:RND family efflux transporter MFP subunit